MGSSGRRGGRALGRAPGARADVPGREMRRSAREYWNELTDEDLKDFDGRADHLTNVLRKRYGWSDEEIEAEIEWWEEDSGNELY